MAEEETKGMEEYSFIEYVPSKGKKKYLDARGLRQVWKALGLKLRITENSVASVMEKTVELANGTERNRSMIEQTASSIRTLVEKVTETDGELVTQWTEIKQTAESINLFAKKITERITGETVETGNLEVAADHISAVVSRVENTENRITTAESNISQTSEQIETTVTKMVETEDGNVLYAMQSSITQNATSIAAKANKSDVPTGQTMYYLVTTKSTGITNTDSGFKATVQTMTKEKPYLWTYVLYTYADSKKNTKSAAVLTGVYGSDGAAGKDGKEIESITPLYYSSTSATKPAAPTTHVTNTSSLGGAWTQGIALIGTTGNKTYKYLFTCNEIYYTDETYAWTTVVRDQTVENLSSRMSRAELVIGNDNITTLVQDGVSGLASAIAQDAASINLIASKITLDAPEVKLQGLMTVYKSDGVTKGGTLGFGKISNLTGIQLCMPNKNGLGNNLITVTDDITKITHQTAITGWTNSITFHSVSPTQTTAGVDGIVLQSFGSTIAFKGTNSTSYEGYFNIGNESYKVRTNACSIVPFEDNKYVLGVSDHRWANVYCIHAENNTSDRKVKTDITYDMSHYLKMFDAIDPTPYRFTLENSDRVHLGFIAQDIEDALPVAGLTEMDFGGFCKDYNSETDAYDYSLRYAEFVPLNTAAIKRAEAKIEAQQAEIDALKAEVAELRQLLLSMKEG